MYFSSSWLMDTMPQLPVITTSSSFNGSSSFLAFVEGGTKGIGSAYVCLGLLMVTGALAAGTKETPMVAYAPLLSSFKLRPYPTDGITSKPGEVQEGRKRRMDKSRVFILLSSHHPTILRACIPQVGHKHQTTLYRSLRSLYMSPGKQSRWLRPWRT